MTKCYSPNSIRAASAFPKTLAFLAFFHAQNYIPIPPKTNYIIFVILRKFEVTFLKSNCSFSPILMLFRPCEQIFPQTDKAIQCASQSVFAMHDKSLGRNLCSKAVKLSQ